LSALAAPLRNPDGAVVGAVSLGGLTASILTDTGAPDPVILAALTDTCLRISERITH
jgi:DNA-binding IclR family transcriptional regulator